MIINVTQEDIDTGTINSDSCPIAKAILRDTEAKYVLVSAFYISVQEALVKTKIFRFFPRNKRFNGFFKPSNSIVKFIVNFDAYGPSAVKPFSFEVNF